MPSIASQLLAEAARLGFKARIEGDEAHIYTTDSFQVAGGRVRVKIGDEGFILTWGRGRSERYSDPRSVLLAAYNISSQLLFKRIASTAAWTVRVLRSYARDPALQRYHREVLGLRGDPGLLVLSASLMGGGEAFEGLSRIPSAARLIAILERRLSGIRHVRHARLGLYAALSLEGLEPWSALAGVYHASITAKPSAVEPARDPLSLALSWEAAWLASACLRDPGLPRELWGLVPPIEWECGENPGGTLGVGPGRCPYPCFTPGAGEEPVSFPLEGYVAYLSESRLLGLLLGTGRGEAVVRLASGLEGPYNSLRAVLEARVEKPERGLLVRLLTGW